MDEDVKLSMQQPQERWMTKMVQLGIGAVLGAIMFWVHDCNQPSLRKPEDSWCTDAVINLNYTTVCPSPHQTLTFPPGWTYGKCTCPETTKPAASN